MNLVYEKKLKQLEEELTSFLIFLIDITMKKSKNTNNNKESEINWITFVSKTRIFTYFIIISNLCMLWWFSMVVTEEVDYRGIYRLILLWIVIIWQTYRKQDRNKILLNFWDEQLNIFDENDEFSKIKYWDIKEFIFLKHEIYPLLWLLFVVSSLIIFGWWDSFVIFIIILWFGFYTLPILLFRRNCRSISIITKDKTIKLPKIKWEKELKEVLEELNIKYSSWWSFI